MDFNHIRSWFELEEITEKQEQMIIIYQKEIEKLQEENEELNEKVLVLTRRLAYYKSVVEGNDDIFGEED